MNLWNVKKLDCPPVATYLAKSYVVDVTTLHSTLHEAIQAFKNQKDLQLEAAILSRIIYRMKMKFRNDRGLKAMEKVNRALLQYLQMNIPSMLQTFYAMVPLKYSQTTYLPTRNMLYFVLVRLQGLAKLLVRVINETLNAAQFMDYRVRIGHFWNIAFICFGVVSRLFDLAKNLFQECCKLYSQLLPFTKSLQNVGSNWLPQNYNLPVDLKSWLDTDLPWLKKETLKPKPKLPSIFDVINVVDSDSDVEYINNYVEIVDDVKLVTEFVEVEDDVELVTEFVEVEDDTNSNEDKIGSRVLNLKENRFRELTLDEDVGEIVQPHIMSGLHNDLAMEEDAGEVIKGDKNLKSSNKINIKQKRKRQKKQKVSQSSAIDQLISTITVTEFVEVEDDTNSNEDKIGSRVLNLKENRFREFTLDEDVGEIVQPDIKSGLHNDLAMEEDAGEVIKGDKNLKSSNKINIKQKRKRQKKQKVSQSSAIDQLISTIKTLKDLQKFSKDFKNIQNEHSGIFKKIDKMQCNMLHGIIKNCLKKAKRHSADVSKVNRCVSEAKEALKITFE